MKNKERKELAVCGWAAVKALCERGREKISRLYFTKEHARDLGDVCRFLASKKKPYNMVENEAELEKLSGTAHHQGAVAMIDFPYLPELTREKIEEWSAAGEDAVFLDRIGNANNLGAIVRSAAFFGVKNIILPLDEVQSFITTSAYRVAEGGMESVEFFAVRKVSWLLREAQGRLKIIGTSLKAKTSVRALQSLRRGQGLLIALGNEEEGISREVEAAADDLVIIPYRDMETGARKALDSLNVAQSAAIIFYECSQKGGSQF